MMKFGSVHPFSDKLSRIQERKDEFFLPFPIIIVTVIKQQTCIMGCLLCSLDSRVIGVMKKESMISALEVLLLNH